MEHFEAVNGVVIWWNVTILFLSSFSSFHQNVCNLKKVVHSNYRESATK